MKFAEDFISKPNRSEVNSIFASYGNEFYFIVMDNQNCSYVQTMVSIYTNEVWSDPVDAEISVRTFDWGAVFSPDNDTLIFEVCLRNNESLPSWLEFNAETKLFFGIPLTPESLNIKVIATDYSGAHVLDEK